jgi:hypothetical protein
MTHKTMLILSNIVLACFACWACEGEENKVVVSYNDPFCIWVDKQKVDSTGRLVNEFLVTLKNVNHAEDLEKLRAWLEAKECVDEAIILCNSCIKTLPPQSELIVSFVTNGLTAKMTMDILMDDTLKFRAYH